MALCCDNDDQNEEAVGWVAVERCDAVAKVRETRCSDREAIECVVRKDDRVIKARGICGISHLSKLGTKELSKPSKVEVTWWVLTASLAYCA